MRNCVSFAFVRFFKLKSRSLLHRFLSAGENNKIYMHVLTCNLLRIQFHGLWLYGFICYTITRNLFWNVEDWSKHAYKYADILILSDQSTKQSMIWQRWLHFLNESLNCSPTEILHSYVILTDSIATEEVKLIRLDLAVV